MRNPLGYLFWAAVQQAAHAYVAGPALADAIHVCHSLAGNGFAATVSCWNSGDDRPDDNAARYLAAIAGIASEGLDSYLSLKLPDLGFSAPLVARILEQAQRQGVPVHFDSLALDTASPSVALLSGLPPGSVYGCTLPGRWRRSLDDADRAIALGLRVRVVKGQWADPADPTRDPAEGFLQVVDRLAGRVPAVAVATHDPALARSALARLRAAGTPAELELLFGLPARFVLEAARAEGVPVRVYVPYGKAFLPYAVKQIRKNPRIAWWTLRDLCAGWAGVNRLPGRRAR